MVWTGCERRDGCSSRNAGPPSVCRGGLDLRVARRPSARWHPACSETGRRNRKRSPTTAAFGSKTNRFGFHYCRAATRRERCTRLHPAGFDSRVMTSTLTAVADLWASETSLVPLHLGIQAVSSLIIEGKKQRNKGQPACDASIYTTADWETMQRPHAPSILSSLICNRLSSDLHRQSCGAGRLSGEKKNQFV